MLIINHFDCSARTYMPGCGCGRVPALCFLSGKMSGTVMGRDRAWVEGGTERGSEVGCGCLCRGQGADAFRGLHGRDAEFFFGDLDLLLGRVRYIYVEAGRKCADVNTDCIRQYKLYM